MEVLALLHLLGRTSVNKEQKLLNNALLHRNKLVCRRQYSLFLQIALKFTKLFEWAS